MPETYSATVPIRWLKVVKAAVDDEKRGPADGTPLDSPSKPDG